jgi:UDP-N-acetyl-D-glucosamine/UDP-N-acetyl-D-galactosamine dehydrogenase
METVAVIGIGYVGLYRVMNLALTDFKIIAYDINKKRIKQLNQGVDSNNDINHSNELGIIFTDDPSLLSQASIYLIDIPTPIDKYHIPNLTSLKSASKIIGDSLSTGDLVIYESTVYPGATNEVAIPILEKQSQLKCDRDFFVGYSPERIVPGNKKLNSLKNPKIIAGNTKESLAKVRNFLTNANYTNLVPTTTIESAEAAKLLENIQRDINIALMNEYSMIMESMGIPFHEVLSAAKTKWNFLPFKPGLVGGHCIPVDPYYLIHKASQFNCNTNLINCARQINESFPHFIANLTVKKLIDAGCFIKKAKLVLLGLSYKPNVSDIRHSLSFELINDLKSFGLDVVVYDPIIEINHINIKQIDWNELTECHVIIMNQNHDIYVDIGLNKLCDKLVHNGIFIDIHGAFSDIKPTRKDIFYWSL